VIATTGPWLDVQMARGQGEAAVGPGQTVQASSSGSVWVEVTLGQARFVHVERITITIGGPGGPQVVHTIAVPANVGRFHWADAIATGDVDTWIGVTADGDTAMPLAQTGTYQKDKWQHPGVTPFAIASPILVDADRDGRWKRGDGDLPAN
jgi:hypothetical protein